MNKTETQYLETALWSSCDFDGVPLNKSHGIEDIEESTKYELLSELEDFLDAVQPVLDTLPDDFEINYPRIAHDFWLTRNRHGAGFWDGDYPDPQAQQLTELAHSWGEIDLYVGDDGRVYQ